MIPKVKTWKVRFYLVDGSVKQTTVETINRRFARWLANEKLGYPLIDSTFVKISKLN